MNDAQLGIVSSTFTLGGFLGALAIGSICAKHGRVRAMQITTIFFIIGPAFESLAPSIAVIAFGRFVSGLGAGASVVVVPMYVSEIAPPAERGFFGSFTQVMVNGGIFVTQFLGYFLSFGSMWRLVLAIGGFIGVALILGLLTVPESPRWLATNGHIRQSREILQRLRGDKFDIEEEMLSWDLKSEDALGKFHCAPTYITLTRHSGSSRRSKIARC
jgi:MFS family permease